MTLWFVLSAYYEACSVAGADAINYSLCEWRKGSLNAAVVARSLVGKASNEYQSSFLI